MDDYLIRMTRMLKSPLEDVRYHAEAVLANVGPPAVRLLVRQVEQGSAVSAAHARNILRAIGSTETLPRKILVDSRLSVSQKIKTYESLSRFYPLSSLTRYCEDKSQDADPAIQVGAREVLTELQRMTLLRPGERDAESDREQLLRTAHPNETESAANLLRPDSSREQPPPPGSFKVPHRPE